MGKTPTPEQELEQLRELIHEAHGVIGDLRRELREARKLTARYQASFEVTANDEIRRLANWIQTELNRHAVSLNADVDKARAEITRQLTTTKLILDPVGDRFEVQFKSGQFAENDPLPYPDHPVKDITP